VLVEVAADVLAADVPLAQAFDLYSRHLAHDRIGGGALDSELVLEPLAVDEAWEPALVRAAAPDV
jgi:hypothetical protein